MRATVVKFHDRFAFSYRLDRVHKRDFAAGHAVYLGASLGPKTAIVGTVVGAVLLLIGSMVAASQMR